MVDKRPFIYNEGDPVPDGACVIGDHLYCKGCNVAWDRCICKEMAKQSEPEETKVYIITDQSSNKGVCTSLENCHHQMINYDHIDEWTTKRGPAASTIHFKHESFGQGIITIRVYGEWASGYDLLGEYVVDELILDRGVPT